MNPLVFIWCAVIILKIANVIDWSWWVVAPFPFVVALGIMIPLCCLIGVFLSFRYGIDWISLMYKRYIKNASL